MRMFITGTLDGENRSVELKMLFFRNVTRQPEYSSDGTTYLWTHWVLDVVCVYNPAQMAFDAGPVETVGRARRLAVDTDVALRNFLSQPRRSISITTEEGGVYLQTPKAGYTVDHNLGPKITTTNIEAMHGDKTFVVHMQVETWLNDCDEEHVLLAHRWKRHQEVNEQHLTTIVTEGECVFNGAELKRLGQHADQFRRALFHPIPNNFQRHNVQVAPASDGLHYGYRFVDTEQMFNKGANCPAVRIEVHKTGWYSKDGVVGSLVNAGRSAFANARFDSSGVSNNLIGSVPGAVISGITNGFLAKYRLSMQVRLWANRISTRDQLRDLGLGIITFHMQGTPASTSDEFILIENLVDRYVEINKTMSWGTEEIITDSAIRSVTSNPSSFAGPWGILANAAVGAIAGISGPAAGNIARSYPAEVIANFQGKKALSSTLTGSSPDNPAPPHNAFGTTLIEMIHAALANPCELPASPPTSKGQGFNPRAIS